MASKLLYQQYDISLAMQVKTLNTSWRATPKYQITTGCSDHPRTSKPAFQVDFSGILQLKNTVLGLIGTQEMHIYLVVWKVGVTHTYANENEEQSWGFVGRILKE